MKKLACIAALSAAFVLLFAGCNKDEKPSEEEKHPDPEQYAEWNTSGEFVVPKPEATHNPNYFLTDEEHLKVLACDMKKGTATLRFEGEVPQLYKGALLTFRPNQDMGLILAYVKGRLRDNRRFGEGRIELLACEIKKM